jgi:hypothetical protein
MTDGMAEQRPKWGKRAKTRAIRREGKKVSRPISRVLSRTIIHLGCASPHTSSSLPESSASNTSGFLFGLAPGGVCRAMECYHPCGALLPHHFTLTDPRRGRRYAFCCTFRRLAPPRCYLAPCSVEPGLSSMSSRRTSQRLSGRLRRRSLVSHQLKTNQSFNYCSAFCSCSASS